jgi:hypothetical protein
MDDKFYPMPSPENAQNIGAAVELLLDEVASGTGFTVDANVWHTIRVSVCRRSDGTLMISNAGVERGW